jgi:hypothetical protein
MSLNRQLLKIFDFVKMTFENSISCIVVKKAYDSSLILDENLRVILTINVPLFKKLRDIIFFGGRITL